jgi:hypothetical protein
MIDTCQLSSTRKALAGILAVLLGLIAAHPAAAESPVETTARSEALSAKRPAKLKRPPPELSPSPDAVRIQSPSRNPRARRSRSATPVAYQPEELPQATRSYSGAPVISPSDQDFILMDEFGAPGPTHGLYDVCDPQCYPCGKVWVRAEYLLWWVEGFSTPALVTTSTAGTPVNEAGILGLPSTSVLFGESRLTDQARSGLRLTVGGWLDPHETTGLQASAFGLLIDNTDFSADSASIPIIARPFFNVEPGFEGQDAELIAYPGLFNGQIDVRAKTSLIGAEALVRQRLAHECYCRVDGLVGFRYNRLHDRLQISDSRQVVGAGTGLAIGTTFVESDLFDTVNHFYGAEVGVIAELCRNQFFVEGTLKLALGNTHSRVEIDGNSTATVPVPGNPPQVANTPAGLLAQATNIGTYESDDFGVIPELGITVGYEFTPHLRATAGYTFMYWTGVARAGDQIDTNLNLSQLDVGGLAGIPRPQFRRVTDDVWVQGLSLGLDYRY